MSHTSTSGPMHGRAKRAKAGILTQRRLSWLLYALVAIVLVIGMLYYESVLYLLVWIRGLSGVGNGFTQDSIYVMDLLQTIQDKQTGYYISETEKKRFSFHKAEFTYGEMLPESVDIMLKEILQLDAGDVFYDLGSGTGKIVLQAFLTTNVTSAIGIELSSRRTNIARASLSKLISLGWISPLDAFKWMPLISNHRNIQFIEGDMFSLSLADATAIYACSNLFSDETMDGLYQKILHECDKSVEIFFTRPFLHPSVRNQIDEASNMDMDAYIPLPIIHIPNSYTKRQLVIKSRHSMTMTWSDDPMECYLYVISERHDQ
jgi:hypothetical protein